MKKWSWLLAMLLGVGMMVCVGCEDDDDDNGGGTTTTVVTNVVNGTTVVVTNTVVAVDEDDDAEADGGTPTPAATVEAPTLLEPAGGASLQGGVVDNTIKVIFAWTDAEGAGDYVLEVNGAEYITTGTSKALHLGWGDYTWRVWSRSQTINVPSGYRSFSIVPTILFIPGL